MVVLPEKLKEALDGPTAVLIATIQPDGSPQVNPVWLGRDGDQLLISTVVGRRKYLNLKRDPRLTVVYMNGPEASVYAEMRGTATMTTEGGAELIDRLSRVYTGLPYLEFNKYGDADEGLRVVIRMTVTKLLGSFNMEERMTPEQLKKTLAAAANFPSRRAASSTN